MSTFEKLMNCIYEKAGSYDKMTAAIEIVDDLFEELKQNSPKLYEKYICDLEGLAYKITREEAEELVRDMQPKGQQWSYSVIKDYIAQKGITTECTEWYLVMNMVYNDYYDTAKLFGLQSDTEFFYSLAKDFIEDPDARPHKVERYFLA